MWFKENKACNFSLNCPLWFWFFFPVTIKEFCSNVDTQGRNSLKLLFYFPLLAQQLLPWDIVVSVGFFFFFGRGCLFHDNFQGGFESSYLQGSSIAGCLSYYISKCLNIFSLQKTLVLSLGKYKCGHNWFDRTGYSVVFENCYPSSHNKLIN